MQTHILKVLQHHFGSRRALHYYYLFRERAGLVLGFFLFICAVTAFVILFRPEPHQHYGFETATLRGFVPKPSEHGAQRLVVDALTKDGQALRLLTRPALLTGAMDTVCLEKRQYVHSGEFRYHIVAAVNCTDNL